MERNSIKTTTQPKEKIMSKDKYPLESSSCFIDELINEIEKTPVQGGQYHLDIGDLHWIFDDSDIEVLKRLSALGRLWNGNLKLSVI